jgi:hypothetical protein
MSRGIATLLGAVSCAAFVAGGVVVLLAVRLRARSSVKFARGNDIVAQRRAEADQRRALEERQTAARIQELREKLRDREKELAQRDKVLLEHAKANEELERRNDLAQVTPQQATSTTIRSEYNMHGLAGVALPTSSATA